jgi:hypothetical protein
MNKVFSGHKIPLLIGIIGLVMILALACIRDMESQSVPPLTTEFYAGSFGISEPPVLDTIVELTFSLETIEDAPNTSIKIFLPEGIQLMDGNTMWNGDIKGGEAVEHSISIKVIEDGEWRIRAWVANDKLSGFDRAFFCYIYPASDAAVKTPSIQMQEAPCQKTTKGEDTRANNNLYREISVTSPGVATVYGYLEYEDDFGNMLPVRYATAELWSDIGLWPMEVSYTNSDGKFEFAVDVSGATNVYVKVLCETDAVKSTTALGSLYYARIPDSGSVTISEGTNYLGRWHLSNQYENWQAYDYVIDEYQWVDNKADWTRPPVTIKWPSGHCTLPDGTPWPCSDGNTIYLPQKNDMQPHSPWQRPTVLHEYAHCIMYHIYGYFPDGCGPSPHYINSESCEGFALMEGWAEFMQCAVDNNPNSLVDFTCGKWTDIEDNNWEIGTDCVADNSGAIVEGAVASIWWDIFDSNDALDPDYDEISLDFDEIFYIIRNHKPDGINQFWDYWFQHYGYRPEINAIYWSHGIDRNIQPSPPSLYIPSDNTIVYTLTPYFDWSTFSDPDEGSQSAYEIRVWEDSGPDTEGTLMVLDKEYSGSASSATPVSSDYINGGLIDGKHYHWHVRVKDNLGAWSDWAADTLATHMDFTVQLPHIELTPTGYTFPDTQVEQCSSPAHSFTLTNTGGGTATGSVSLTGSNADQFEITSGSGGFSLGAGATKTISVRFCPKSTGFKSASLFAAGSNCNDDTSSLSGTGCVPPGTPGLVSPSNGQTVSTTPSLDWSDVSGATSYDIEVCSDSGCTSVVRSANVGSSQWTVSPALNEGVTYYWHARAKNSCGPGSWSSIRSFTTTCPTPGVPSLVSPSNGQTELSTTPSLDWGDVSGATSYDVEVCSDSGCTSVVRSANVGSSQWTVSPALSEGVTYYWHARARNSCGTGSWSSIRSFTTQGGCVLPGTPGLVSPTNGQTVSTTLSLDWGDVSGATSYDVEVCSDSGCTSVVRSANVGSSQWTVSPALSEGVTYYWHARARNSCGTGSWSSIRSFTTSSIPPTPDLIPAGIAFNVNSAVHRVWINWDEDLLAQAQIDWWLEAGANLDPSDVFVSSPSGTNPNGGVYEETIKTKDTIDNVPCIEIQAWRSGDIQIFVRITYDGYDWTLHTEKKWGELHHTILDVDAKTTAVEHIKHVEFGTDEVYYEETLKDTVWAEFLYLSGTVLVDSAIVHWWLVEDTDANQAWVDAFMDYLAAHGGGLDDDHWAAHGAYMMSDLGGREPWEYINDWVCGPDEIANTADDRAVDPSLFYWSAVDIPGQIDATGNTCNWYAWAETDDGVATATLSVDVDGLAPYETYEFMTVVLVSYPGGGSPQHDPYHGENSVCLEKGKIEFHKISVNNPPYAPYNLSPANHAIGVSINADLSWTGGDPDAGDTVTYDVYFGTTSTPPLVSNDQSGTTYDPGTLAYNTKYYWKIVARDNHGMEMQGPVWDLSTVVPATTATRNLPDASVDPSEQFDVGIVASGCGFAGQVRETLPTGFAYVSCSDPDIYVTMVGQEVRFTIFGDSADFSYTVQAPAERDTYTFAGVVLDQNQTQSIVGGDTSVTVGDPWVYDENSDGIIQKSEAIQAVIDYFDGLITKAQVIEVLLLYFS